MHRERGGFRQTERQTDGQRQTQRYAGRQTDRQTDRQIDRQTENSNSKTLFYKDCNLGSIKTCLTTVVLAKLLMNN